MSNHFVIANIWLAAAMLTPSLIKQGAALAMAFIFLVLGMATMEITIDRSKLKTD